jgi:hypothetical protein
MPTVVAKGNEVQDLPGKLIVAIIVRDFLYFGIKPIVQRKYIGEFIKF